MKEFNTTAVCIPAKHYMVDLSARVKEIKKMVDAGKYFTINRARQYGKTTTIDLLCSLLAEEYIVLSLDFQDISDAVFKTEVGSDNLGYNVSIKQMLSVILVNGNTFH